MSNNDNNIEKRSFEAFVNAIGSEIEQAQVRLISAANAQMLFHYWKMGNYILYHQNRQGWGGKVIKKNFVGKDLKNYDSMLVLSHFKGHPMGGYGGALKQLSIGVASSYGKAYIHGAGVPENIWTADHDSFLESMADAAGSVVNYFHGNMIFINVMKNMSVDCDCCEIAEDPCMTDMGILVSTDPIAIDQACIDLVYGCDDPGKAHFLERVESRNGVHTIEAAAALGYGSREYTLVRVD
mgnify:CR=1 FL=1